MFDPITRRQSSTKSKRDQYNLIGFKTPPPPLKNKATTTKTTQNSVIMNEFRRILYVFLTDILPSEGILSSESIENLQSEINNNFSESENVSVFSSCHREMTPGISEKPPLYLGQEDDGNSCDKKAVEIVTGRLSPEGAECSAVNVHRASENGDTDSYPGIPRNRFLNEARMIDKIESCLSYSPSGYIDAQIEWTVEETQEENREGEYSPNTTPGEFS